MCRNRPHAPQQQNVSLFVRRVCNLQPAELHQLACIVSPARADPRRLRASCAAAPAALTSRLCNERARAPATAIAKGNRLLRQVLRIVTHPATIIAGVVCGLLFGFFLPKPAHALVPFAKL
jgi:hypothetical protein